MDPLQLWGGAECTVNRVGARYGDQIALTGHADRPDDLERFADLGLRTLRVALPWERIETSPGLCDWAWADDTMARIERLGIRPVVGLIHHGSGPRWTGLVDPGFAPGLAEHAARVVERYPWALDWTPVNEPLTTARFACLYGHWHPHLSDERAFWVALLNQIEATVLSMRAIRQVQPAARLIQTEDYGVTRSTPACADQADYDNRRRLMTWDLLCGRVGPEHPLFARLDAFGLAGRLTGLGADPCPPDVIGLNHYVTSDRFLDDRTWLYPPHLRGGNGRLDYADTEAVRVLPDWVPGWSGFLESLHARYRLPVAVTECHLGCETDQQIAWLHRCWQSALDARVAGVPVEAVTVWALAGSVGWDRLLTEPAGRYEPGVLDAARPGAPVTALAGFVRRLARGAPLPQPATGWWERPDRLHAPFHPPSNRPAALVA